MTDKVVELRPKFSVQEIVERIKPRIPEEAYLETTVIDQLGLCDQDWQPKVGRIEIQVNSVRGRRAELLEAYEQIRALIPGLTKSSFIEAIEWDEESYSLVFECSNIRIVRLDNEQSND